MANKKNLPKLSKRTANLEGRLDNLEKRADDTENEVKELSDVVHNINNKVSLLTIVAARNAAKVKKIQQDANAKPDATNTIAALTSSMNIIASSLGIMNASLSKALGVKMTPMGAQQVEAPGPSGVPEPKDKDKDKEQGMFGLLKGLFTNPAVVAAMAGIVYTVLPKESQEQIKGLMGGFADGLEETMGKNEESGLGGFNTALKGAGIALTAYFGAKMIGGIASAISSTMKIIKLMGGGKIGRGLAVIGTGAAVGGATAFALSGSEEDSGEGANAGQQPESKEPPSGFGIKPSTEAPSGGVGIKPGGKVGIKVPEMSGEDKPVMDMIKQHEGVRTKPYKDSLGLWTVGVGHLIGDGKSLPPEWNREFSMNEVDTLFAKDYIHHKEAAQKIPGYQNLNATGKAALTDLTFNMGPAWHKRWPNFTKALAAGDTEGAARSLEESKWYSQVGSRAATIVAMIRNGGKGNGSMLLDSSGSPVTSGAGEAVTTGSNMGQEVNSLSQNVKHAARPGSLTSMASVDNSTRGGVGSQEAAPPLPIPSPIASRGSLGSFTRHNTAYA
jgi:lysozyme